MELPTQYEITIDGQKFLVELSALAGAENRWRCRVNGRDFEIDAVLPQLDVLSLITEGNSFEIKRERTAAGEHILLGGQRYAIEVRDPKAYGGHKRADGTAKGPQAIVAPMPGKVIRVLLPEGAAVAAGQGVIVVEAMKMQNELKSPRAGTIEKVLAREGATVNAGDKLVIVN